MVEAKKNTERGRSKEQCSPARIVSGKENLKSPGNQGRVYGEGWGMFFSKAESKGLPRPFNAAWWRCSYMLFILGSSPNHTPIKYRGPIEKSNRITSAYLISFKRRRPLVEE